MARSDLSVIEILRSVRFIRLAASSCRARLGAQFIGTTPVCIKVEKPHMAPRVVLVKVALIDVDNREDPAVAAHDSGPDPIISGKTT
jgi:hypothetical protein